MPATSPTPEPPLTAEQLPNDPATLKCMLLEAIVSLQQSQRERDALQEQLARLLRRLYGPRSERFDPDQPTLFDPLPATPEPAAHTPPEPATPAQRRCRPHGRRRLPSNLPRECRHHELPQAARLCSGCGQLRVDIGVDRSEQLEYRPASLLVIEHLVHKYACPHCRPTASSSSAAVADAEPEAMSTPEPQAQAALAAAKPADPAEPAAAPPPSAAPAPVVLAASKPAGPIAKGLPGPGLLAHLIVSKYVDHLPLYRLERIYQRQGVFLPRSTLSDWLAASAQLLRPVYAQLVSAVLRSRALHTDDTVVKMQERGGAALRTARLWVYLGDVDRPYNVFDFTLTRKRDGPQQFLKTYRGYLHADAFSGYDGLYLPAAGAAAPRIVEVACNAHARRKFYEAKSSATLEAHVALAYYRQLYALERGATDADLNEVARLQMRQEIAVPILEQFHRWLEAQQRQVLPKSPLAEAVGYALRNWAALVRYTEAGYLQIDNNVAEHEMKRIAIGRKNWLFVGSPQGGQTAAVLLSFASTCQRLQVEPWAYLQDVLTRLPSMPADQVAELLPDRWQAARPQATASPLAPSSETSDPSADPVS
jgi:transposase